MIVFIKKLTSNLICPLIVVVALIASILMVSLDRSFYTNQYIKNDTEFYTGMSLDDLNRTTDLLLKYLCKQSDDIYLEALVDGNVRPVFDERETMHMVDVQKIFILVIYLEMFLIIALISCIIYSYKAYGSFMFFKDIFIRYKKFVILSLGIASIFAVVFICAFDWFWTNFHLVFFSNDLWILDPAVSIMINMFPLNFFLAICVNILILFLVIIAAIYISLYLLSRYSLSKSRIRGV